jgi:hypothetical protein
VAVAIATNVIDGADVAVVTWLRVVGVDATFKCVAGVIGAEVLVITVEGFGAHTFTVCADVYCGTGISIVAGLFVGGVDASFRTVAGVGGADVLIVTDYRVTRQTFSLRADVVFSTGIAIFARL